ncbi:MAG: hypothetical protein H6552_00690 [Chitinophagales bacterium]|nr:hypothetical protein [Chitinophagales bacterium]
MKTFKIVQTDGVNGEFVNPNWVKDSYENANEASKDFMKLVKEVETEYEYVSAVREKENWFENYEPKQSERFDVELQMFVTDEDGEELTPFEGDEFNEETSKALAESGFGNNGWITSDDFYRA